MQIFAENTLETLKPWLPPLYPAYSVAKLPIKNSSPDIAYVEFGWKFCITDWLTDRVR